jgi:hypothetical protein
VRFKGFSLEDPQDAHVGDPLRVASGQTHDVDRAKRWGDVLGEPLVNKDADNDEPEDFETLLLFHLALVTVQGVEKVNVDEVQRVQHDLGAIVLAELRNPMSTAHAHRWVDEHLTEQTCKSVADELRSEDRENRVARL